MSEGDPENDLRDLMLAENPDFEEVMRCVFHIQNHETHTYLELLDRPGSTVAELAGHLEKDRSSVNRSLTTLLEKGLVEREHRLLDTGGYVYQYTAVPLAETQEMMHAALDDWCAFMHEKIDEFGEM
jgi:predicted transcriptional regulator